MKQHYYDAMALCKYHGFPDIFITFTCNPKWPEVTRYLKKYNLTTEDRSEILCRVFKMKLDNLIGELTKKNCSLFGHVAAGKSPLHVLHIAYINCLSKTTTLDSIFVCNKFLNILLFILSVMYTIEFQKRGMPHAHILVFMEK